MRSLALTTDSAAGPPNGGPRATTGRAAPVEPVRDVAGEAANRVGLTPQFLADTRETLSRVKESNAATIPPLMGAFAVGVALASKLQSWRHRDDDEYDFVEADYDDDDRYDADGFYR